MALPSGASRPCRIALARREEESGYRTRYLISAAPASRLAGGYVSPGASGLRPRHRAAAAPAGTAASPGWYAVRHTSFPMARPGRPWTGFLGIAALVFAACAAAIGAGFALTARATHTAQADELRAFQRPAQVSDAVPHWAVAPFTSRFGTVSASRRIATATGLRGRAALYLVRLKRNYTCLIRIDRSAAGSGCSPSREFLSAKRRVNAGGGDGFLEGVASNGVVRVAFVDRHWRLRPVRLTRDGGFLYVCRNRNGCVDVVKAVNGYDRHGRLVWHQPW